MQTENKWLDQIDEIDRIDEALPVALGAILKVGGGIARAGLQVAARAAQMAVRGAAKAGKAMARAGQKAAKGAQKASKNISKKIKKKIKDKAKEKIKDKAIELAKQKAEKEIEKQEKSAEKAMNEQIIKEFRLAFRKRMIREIMLMEAEPAGDGGKGKMNPEDAKAIKKELEGETVKSKKGKEIKVTSALNPTYKEKDPRAHKLAKAKFEKTAKEYFAKKKGKGKAKKAAPKKAAPKKKQVTPSRTAGVKGKDDQGRDITTYTTTSKSGRKTDMISYDDSNWKKKRGPWEGVKRPESMDKKPNELKTSEMKAENTETRDQQEAAAKNLEDKKQAAKDNPRDTTAVVAIQKAADENLESEIMRVESAERTMDHYDAQKEQIKERYPDPTDPKRRELLKKIRDEKQKAFEETGYNEESMIKDRNKKRLKGKYDKMFDPTNEEGSTDFEHDGTRYEMAGTRANPETGEVMVYGYEVDEEGNKKKDEDGNPIESSMPAMQFEDEAKNLSPADAGDAEEEKSWFKERMKKLFDFSDPINLEDALGLEMDGSSYVDA